MRAGQSATDLPPEARSATRLAWWLGLVGLLVAVNYLGRYASDEPAAPGRDFLYRWETFGGALFQFGLILGVMLLIARGAPRRGMFALHPVRRWGEAAGLMVGIFVATYVVAAIVSALGANPGEEQGLTPEGWDPDRADAFLANAVVVALFVPVVEELTFRGLGFTLIAARFGAPAAIVVTALLFGAGHGVVYGLPIFIALGLGLAWLRARSGSVLPCIILHAVFNSVSLIVSVTYGGGT